MSEQERRAVPRVAVNRPGRIRVAGGPETNTQVMDISASGATLFCNEPVKIGTDVELRFHLNIGARTACLAYGHVKHYLYRSESHIVGVHFTHFGPETPETIAEFLRMKVPS